MTESEKPRGKVIAVRGAVVDAVFASAQLREDLIAVAHAEVQSEKQNLLAQTSE